MQAVPVLPPHSGSPCLIPLLYYRASVPAKPCTPLTLRMCRNNAPAARPRGQSLCVCPCTAPTAPSCTTRSSMPCSAGALPGNAASEDCTDAVELHCCLCHGLTSQRVPPTLVHPALVPSWAHNKDQALVFTKAGGGLCLTSEMAVVA